MAILLLLIGTFGMVLSFTPVNAIDTYYYLTIGYDPCPDMPEPDTAPTVGVHDYTVDSVINVTAPLIVDDTTGVQWSFLKWMVFYLDGSNVSITNNKFQITMDENKTAIAYYKIQYYLDVVSPFGTPWGAGWYDEYAYPKWARLDIGSYVIGSGHVADFVDWTGDGSGTDYVSIDSAINMTGPKYVYANWIERVYLWVNAEPSSHVSPPSGQQYYDKGDYATLTPSEIGWGPCGGMCLKFDYWELDGVKVTPVELNLTVYMDAPHVATCYYEWQYYLTVKDHPAAIDTGVEGQSGWFWTGDDASLTIPNGVFYDLGSGVAYRFDHWWVSGVGSLYTPDIDVQMTGPKDAICVLQKQYFMDVNVDPVGLEPYVTLTGEGWYDEAPPYGDNYANMTHYPGIVDFGNGTRYVWNYWDLDGGYKGADFTIYLGCPHTATGHYQLQYLVSKDDSPIDMPGFANSWWFAKGWNGVITAPTWWDEPGEFVDWVFDKWVIGGVPQVAGATVYHITNLNGPIDGIAEYKQMKAFLIDPQAVEYDAPAECETFDVNVTVTNFEDLYAMDWNVTWDPTLIELVGVDVELGNLWTNYFIAKNETGSGYYWLVATSLDAKGFNGTAKVVKLTFHVIYDPCYTQDLSPQFYKGCKLDVTVEDLSDSNGHKIWDIWRIQDGYYRINAIKPKLEMRPDKIIKSELNAEFPVEIWIVDAVKLHDWHTIIWFNNVQLQAIKVEINEDFLKGDYSTFYYHIGSDYVRIDVVQLDGAPLAYGEGLLATINFKVIKGIFWTTSNPTLTSNINFDATYTKLSVKCNDYAEIPYSLIDITDADYTYDPIPGDLNMDGIVNGLDLKLVADDYGSSTTYDLNTDGKVNLFDLVLVAINFERTAP